MKSNVKQFFLCGGGGAANSRSLAADLQDFPERVATSATPLRYVQLTGLCSTGDWNVPDKDKICPLFTFLRSWQSGSVNKVYAECRKSRNFDHRGGRTMTGLFPVNFVAVGGAFEGTLCLCSLVLEAFSRVQNQSAQLQIMDNKKKICYSHSW